MSKITDRAKALATELHKGQVRKHSGKEYIVHPRSVVWFLKTHGFRDDENLLCAAWLHDTVEDCDYSLEEIEKEFGADVAQLVGEVTQPNIVGNRSLRWEGYLNHYARGSVRGRCLKLADRICNLTDYYFDFDVLQESDKNFLRRVYLPESCELHYRFSLKFLDLIQKNYLDILLNIINFLEQELKDES